MIWFVSQVTLFFHCTYFPDFSFVFRALPTIQIFPSLIFIESILILKEVFCFVLIHTLFSKHLLNVVVLFFLTYFSLAEFFLVLAFLQTITYHFQLITISIYFLVQVTVFFAKTFSSLIKVLILYFTLARLLITTFVFLHFYITLVGINILSLFAVFFSQFHFPNWLTQVQSKPPLNP